MAALSPGPDPSGNRFGGIHSSSADCLVMVSTGGSGATNCSSDIAWVGTCTFPSGEQWLSFACDEHANALDVPRPLTTRDITERERRQQAVANALNGRPWLPPKPLRVGFSRR